MFINHSIRRAPLVVVAAGLLVLATAVPVGASPPQGKAPGKACVALQQVAPGNPGKALKRGAVADRAYVEALCGAADEFVYMAVTAVSPSNGATDVSPLTMITVTFSTWVDSASVAGNVTLVDESNNEVALGSPILSQGGTVAEVSPQSPLAFGTTYTIRVQGGAGGVIGGEGEILEQTATSTFTTVELHPTCDDGIDNDGDGLIDLEDPDCADGGPEGGF